MKEHHLNKHPYRECSACIETSKHVIQNPTKYGLTEDPSHEEICYVLDRMDNGQTKQHMAIHEWHMKEGRLKRHTIYILPLNKDNESVCAEWKMK